MTDRTLKENEPTRRPNRPIDGVLDPKLQFRRLGKEDGANPPRKPSAILRAPHTKPLRLPMDPSGSLNSRNAGGPIPISQQRTDSTVLHGGVSARGRLALMAAQAALEHGSGRLSSSERSSESFQDPNGNRNVQASSSMGQQDSRPASSYQRSLGQSSSDPGALSTTMRREGNPASSHHTLMPEKYAAASRPVCLIEKSAGPKSDGLTPKAQQDSTTPQERLAPNSIEGNSTAPIRTHCPVAGESHVGELISLDEERPGSEAPVHKPKQASTTTNREKSLAVPTPHNSLAGRTQGQKQSDTISNALDTDLLDGRAVEPAPGANVLQTKRKMAFYKLDGDSSITAPMKSIAAGPGKHTHQNHSDQNEPESGLSERKTTNSGASRSICFAAESRVTSIAISLDGLYVIAGCDDGLIRLYDMACTLQSDRSGHVIGQLQGSGRVIVAVHTSDDGRFCFAGARMGSSEVLAFDLEHFTLLKKRRGFTSTQGLRVYKHSDAKMKGLAAVIQASSKASDAATAFFPADNCRREYRLVCGLGIKPCRVWSFSAIGDEVPIWSCIFDEHTNGNTMLLASLTRNGTVLYSRSDDKNLRVWDLRKTEGRSTPYRDIPGTKDIKTIVGDTGFGGGESIVIMDLQSQQRLEVEFPAETASSTGSKRRRCMRSVLDITGTQDNCVALVSCTDGKLYRVDYTFEDPAMKRQPAATISTFSIPGIATSDGSLLLRLATVKRSPAFEQLPMLLIADNGGKDVDTVLRVAELTEEASSDNSKRNEEPICWWCREPGVSHWKEEEEDDDQLSIDLGHPCTTKDVRQEKVIERRCNGISLKHRSSNPVPVQSDRKKMKTGNAYLSSQETGAASKERENDGKRRTSLSTKQSNNIQKMASTDQVFGASRKGGHELPNEEFFWAQLVEVERKWKDTMARKLRQERKKFEEKMSEVTAEADRRFQEEKRLRKQWNQTEQRLVRQIQDERSRAERAEQRAREAEEQLLNVRDTLECYHKTQKELLESEKRYRVLRDGGTEQMDQQALTEIGLQLTDALTKNNQLKMLKSLPSMCVVCRVARASYIIDPCGHYCLCEKDALEYEQRNIPTCPVCLGPRQKQMKVFAA